EDPARLDCPACAAVPIRSPGRRSWRSPRGGSRSASVPRWRPGRRCARSASPGRTPPAGRWRGSPAVATSPSAWRRSVRATRRPDPRLAARIEAALGDARTVLNVGAGTGSYEPADREVTAVEPSAVMIEQRPPGAAPVVQARAEALPFGDDEFDAAMAIITI